MYSGDFGQMNPKPLSQCTMENNGMTTVVFLVFLLSHTYGMFLSRILQEIEPHKDIYILSDTVFQEDKLQQWINGKFIYSAYNTTFLTDDNLFGVRKHVQVAQPLYSEVTMVVNMKSEKTTFQTIEYIGNKTDGLADFRRVSAIVVWPTTLESREKVDLVSRHQDFLQAMKNFKVNANLFFAFEVNSATESNGTTTAIYETYLAGNYTVFRYLEKGLIVLNCNQCEGPAIRRFNFHQRNLKVTAVNDSEVNDDIQVYMDSNGTISYSKDGFSGSILQILQQLLNFTVEPGLSKEFGSRIPGTNRWKGSIGEVAEGVSDMAMSITIFQPERASVVSFLPPVDEHLINAFFTPPDINAIRDIFAQPFKPELWAAVITTWVVLASCMVIFSIIRKRYGLDGQNDKKDGSSPDPDFTHDSFIWALGTACQQGWDEHPRAGSLRTIFISGSFTGVVAYAGYSAAIVSTLSLRVDPIQNPLQLLRSNLRVGIRKGFISSLLEQNNTRDTMSLFYKRVQKSKEYERYLNVSAGFEHILKHPYAFITTRDTIYDLMKMTTDDKVICGIKDLPILKYGFPIGYPVSRFSPLKEILRYAMIMIREPGVLWRLRMKYSFKRRCLEAADNAGYALGPNDVFTAFMILVAGFTLSITFLVIERMVSFKQFSYVR